MDYFPPSDWLLIVDESHISVPQVRGMYFGDRMRKETLVRHGANYDLIMISWKNPMHRVKLCDNGHVLMMKLHPNSAKMYKLRAAALDLTRGINYDPNPYE